MNKFIHVEPLLGLCNEPWVRIATDEAKCGGTYVHIGYGSQGWSNQAILDYETAKKLRDWLNEALDEETSTEFKLVPVYPTIDWLEDMGLTREQWNGIIEYASHID